MVFSLASNSIGAQGASALAKAMERNGTLLELGYVLFKRLFTIV